MATKQTRPDARRVFLMYHELELPGRPLCQSELGYVRYVVSAADFESQMHWLRSIGWHGMSVTEALAFPDSEGVVLTFDDGCETDLLAAASILAQTRFSATFYITVGFLGKAGYLFPSQLRELGDQGFEIGCHSMTHPYLNDLPEDRLHREIVHAKRELEQMLGRSVDHFSCPGGRWSARVAEVAKEAGYHSLATSRAVANPPHADRFSLGRVAVLRGTALGTFQCICRGHGLWKLQVQDLLRSTARLVLGNSSYDRLRSRMLSGTVR
jgi:peptidoglycan/xylan/chitin deacetylase (PgdA/CDA1 family)